MLVAQLGIFAWAIIKTIQASYDAREAWYKVRTLPAGSLILWIFFFLAFLAIAGTGDALGMLYLAFMATAGVTIFILQRITA